MDPDAYCQEKGPPAGSSAYYASLFLPPEKKRVITALHAFSNEIGATAGAAREEAVARLKLAWWRAQIDLLFDGRPEHPVMQALRPRLQSAGIRREDLMAIAEGADMDFDQNRHLDWPGLRRYCLATSGALARLSAGALGAVSPGALDHAQTLGLAVQLTRLLRAAGEHARRGRIYLPMDELKRFDVKPAEILNGVHSERFAALMQYQAERARGLFREALALLPAAERRAQRPGLILAAIHLALLDEIEREGWRVLDQRISLTPLRKLWLAWKTQVFLR